LKKLVKIALVGNPNSGKSTLFNVLTGLNQQVANFPGVTVDKKTGICKLQSVTSKETYPVEIIDLPGTYSLYPKSLDERIPFLALCDPHNDSYPDITVIIADGSNLKRSLFLCSQVVDLRRPCILALNMIDLVKIKGLTIDLEALSLCLGIKIVPINARKNIGIEELKKALSEKIPPIFNDFIDIHTFAPKVLDEIKAKVEVNSNYSAFQIAINLDILPYFETRTEVKEHIRSFLAQQHFDAKKLQAQESLERYSAISHIISKCVQQSYVSGSENNLTNKIDHIVTHRIWGYLFFLLVLFLLFQAIFSFSSYPMTLVENGFAFLSQWISTALPQGLLNDLIVNGILAGPSGIVVFVPQIALLFTFIAVLEDTGYMARVSFIMDKPMRKFGLDGKSVIPLMGGMACAVPAIMATRTIQNWKERIITIMVTPLMSCSARIPVYTLLISMVVPNVFVWGFINLQGVVLMALYLVGFLAAIGSALAMKYLIKAREKGFFIMEMPVYRMPRWSNIGLTIVEKVKLFLFEAGKVIIAISIVLWVLSSFGPGDSFKNIEKKYKTENNKNHLSENERHVQMQSEKLSASYAGRIGKTIEPLIRPLGFDWKIGIALVTSFAAREVFVGTMATIYSVGEDGNNQKTVRQKMAEDINPYTGKPLYNLAVGFSLMLFYAFAMQCMSTVAVVFKETGSWKWPVIQIVYMSALAYFSSMLIYQLLK
jgi:ferrous iron transport protein B